MFGGPCPGQSADFVRPVYGDCVERVKWGSDNNRGSGFVGAVLVHVSGYVGATLDRASGFSRDTLYFPAPPANAATPLCSWLASLRFTSHKAAPRACSLSTPATCNCAVIDK